MMDFHEIWYTGDAIEDDFEATFSSHIASTTIPKWLTF
jgi:hypothetical protein